MTAPTSSEMSRTSAESGDIALQRPSRAEHSKKPPVSLFNNNNKNGLDVSASRESSVVRNINGSFPPGAQTPSQASLGIDSTASFTSSILQEEARLRWDSKVELEKVSKTLLTLQKWLLILVLLTVNGILIWISYTYFQLYYLFIILLSSNTTLQLFMMACILANWIGRRIMPCCFGKKEIIPAELEKMVLLLPCYNETHEELTRSLDSLVIQADIDGHPRAIFIIVDGDARGPGMTKTTQQYLIEDILEPGQTRRFENGYRARDGLFMPVKVQTGYYKGIPYVFVGKSYNQGKRDSLCFARSLLYHFKMRSENVLTMFNNDLYEYIGNSFVQFGVDTVDYLVGMDADTVFDKYCIREMLREIRQDPNIVGVCGHVCVDFDGKWFSPWSLYQSVEYSQTQGLRRMFQSRITGKVNCLPGCCQLIRVDESTFGDAVLRDRFGYCPKPNDIMTQHIMGNYSEDSIHASIIFSLHPDKLTAQALRAKAYTIVPQNWKVFLSQRKRWALGSISNEFVMIFRPGIVFIERLQSIIAVMTWAITPFIIAAVVELIMLFVRKGQDMFHDPIFISLITVLFTRYFYSFCVGFWLPRNMKERIQYFVGYFIHFLTSPFMNIIIMMYSLFNSDDFKWGKTREVVKSDAEGEKAPEDDRNAH
ncbi:hypothetical protein MKX08_009672 [Trichoderma sp. CBMAI-0020]|nr:hypothetical protein MKX08_009672 [Trichoderma sp. CBMAI-0020]